MKLILVVKRLLSFLLVRSVSLIPEQDFIAEFHIFLVQDSLPSFLKVNMVSINDNCHQYTYNQILSLPELEDPPIEDWHEYEHVQGDPICKSPDEVPDQRMVVA